MLINKLRQWEYYYHKIPLYVRNSYGIVEHFKIMYDLMIHLDNTGDTLVKGLDVFNNNYFTNINCKPDDYSCDILEKVASLYGITRDFDVTYKENDVDVKRSLHLTNSELLKLVKARIIQNNYSGSYADSRILYENINLPIYLCQSANDAEVLVILDSSYGITTNERYMFLANLFTIQSMGITYLTSINEVKTLLLWDTTNELKYWDKGRWL